MIMDKQYQRKIDFEGCLIWFSKAMDFSVTLLIIKGVHSNFLFFFH